MKYKILKILTNNYLKNNSSVYDIVVLNSLLLSNTVTLHDISICIRQLQSKELVLAKFDNLDECIYIELTDKGKTYLKHCKYKIIGFLLSLLATFLITYLANVLSK